MSTELEQQAIETIVETVIRQLEASPQLLAHYREKYPDLKDFEDYITIEIAHAIREACGTPENFPPLGDLIEQGVSRFNDKLKGITEREAQKLVGQQVNRRLMQLDLSNGVVGSKKLTPDDIWNMPSDRFAEYDQMLAKQLYQ